MIRNAVCLFASAAAAVSLVATAAQASGINVTDARIAGGKLVIAGTTEVPNSWVRLDGQTDSQFNVKSGANGAFAFGIVYHPGDCIVELQRLNAPGNLGPASEALVADCGPAGVTPRGAWSRTAGYVANDLVTFDGSTWRARRGNAARSPVAGADWELFAAGAAEAATADEAAALAGGATPYVAPTGPAGGDLTGNYPNPTIKPGAVTWAKLGNLVVSTVKLGNAAVTAPKIASGAVTSDAILDGSVTTADLADNAVTTAKIAVGSVFGSDIFDGSITSVDIGTAAVGSSEIANGSIVAADIASHGIDMSRIDGTDHYGNIGVGGISSGRCTTVTIAIGGAKAGDAGILTTDGTLPDGEVMYLQRVLADTAHVKICNLSGGDLPAVTVAARILTFH